MRNKIIIILLIPTITLAAQISSTLTTLRIVFPAACPVGIPETPNGAIPALGVLRHDGPATPEQLSLYIPVSGALDKNLKANVIYKKTSESTWCQAHPLFRIRPEFAYGNPADAFAGIIFDLTPGASYDVQVSVKSGSVTDVKTLTVATRALPAESGTANKFVASTAQINSAIASLNPGDILEIANGTYDVSGITISRKGTAAAPIVIRGASRDGVILKNKSRVIQLTNAEHVILERMTLEGSGVDSGTDSSSLGLQFWDGYNQKNITIRNMTIQKVDQGIIGYHQVDGALIYDNTLLGNNQWDQDFYTASRTGGAPGAGDQPPKRDGEQNIFWNDDGIRMPGQGNAIFNNTFNGFGDNMAVEDGVNSVGVHFYRNKVTMGGDDGVEGDYAVRNFSFYDNHMQNTMTFVSFDPLYSGPAYIFRNIAINHRRGPLKLNNQNVGFFFYNNTIVTIDGLNGTPEWAYAQSNNGSINAWAYCNNILMRKNVPNLLAFESSGNNPIDFTNNGWFPNGSVWWTQSGGSFSNMAAAYSGLPATTPLFGTSTKRHDKDFIIESNPFETEIVFPSTNYRSLITTFYTPSLKSTSIAKAKGKPVPNITDGFSGAAPDVGAVIAGRPLPVYGDRKK